MNLNSSVSPSRDRFGTWRSSEARRSFLLQGGPVRVLGGMTLEGSGEDSY